MTDFYCCRCMQPLDGNACPRCGPNGVPYRVPRHHLHPGTLLSNRYLVNRALGEGGFGITYIGSDTNLELTVAIKEYYPGGLADRDRTVSHRVVPKAGKEGETFRKGLESFMQEARILAKLVGEPGIVGVRDYFEANGTAYIVMEYLRGETLKAYTSRRGKLSFSRACKLLAPVINSMERVHAKGLIHRDISPDNIMLLGDGRVKLLDFGAARHVIQDSDRGLPVVLKPGYAPEEQYRAGSNQGPWTDVYALCAVIYRCVTGKEPIESITRVYCDELKKPSELGIAITPEQEAVLLRGMAVQASHRIPSMTELRVEPEALGLEEPESPNLTRTVSAVLSETRVITPHLRGGEDSSYDSLRAAGVKLNMKRKTTEPPEQTGGQTWFCAPRNM